LSAGIGSLAAFWLGVIEDLTLLIAGTIGVVGMVDLHRPSSLTVRCTGPIPCARERKCAMQLTTIKIEKPDDINFILGQSHFVKTVEDIHEAMVQTIPGIKFAVAFCEASGAMLVRWSGTDEAMIELAKRNALTLSAGHSFIVFLGPGFFPINVLNTIKMIPEVCRVFCATANPVEVVIAETDQGRGIMGVIDGGKSTRIEEEKDIAWRKDLLRKIGYKL
jgi:adenosine/AMP kinase